MRQITVTEKYNAVQEGAMAKKEFVRQMKLAYPMYVSNFDDFNSTIQILKTRNLLYEAAKKKTIKKTEPKSTPSSVSLDALDRGVRIELQSVGHDVTLGLNRITKEDYNKAYQKSYINRK